MQGTAKAITNVSVIREVHSREPQNALPFLFRDRTQGLIERWQAPILPEEEIEAWATRYRLCPKSGMSFIEFLISRGVGEIA